MLTRETFSLKKLTGRFILACNVVLCAVLAVGVWLTWPNETPRSTTLIASGVSVGNKMTYLKEGNEICRAAEEEALRIEVEAVMKSITDFPNVFQTDDFNMGVRLEANSGESSQEADLAYVFTRSDGEVFGVPVGKIFKDEKFTTVLTIYEGKALVASLNGVQVQPVLSDVALSCDAVKIGGGFSADRSLVGDASVDFFELTGFNRPAPKLTRFARTSFIASLLILTFVTRRSLLNPDQYLKL